MDPAILRNWDILSQLTGETLSELTAAQIFGGSAGKLGALLLTNNDKVLYVGDDIGHLFYQGKIPPDQTKAESRKRKLVLVESPLLTSSNDETNDGYVPALSGRGIVKLVVRNFFGVAITKEQNLLLWGNESLNTIPDSATVFYELFTPNTYCLKCQHYCYDKVTHGGLQLNCCKTLCSWYPTLEGTGSPGSKRVVKLLNFEEAVTCCTKCDQACTPLTLGDYSVNFCQPCNYLVQDAVYTIPHRMIPAKINLGRSVQIVDVDCGFQFCVALTSDNNLILWGTISNKYEYQGIIQNPDSITVKSFSCGRDHVAVVGVKGELYTCGAGDLGQLGYEWTADMRYSTLRKVLLPHAVAKVCCGKTSTVCLLTNGSLMCFGSNMKMQPSGMLDLNQANEEFITKPARIMENTRFTDVFNASLTNVYVATTATLTFTWGREENTSFLPSLVEGEGHPMRALHDLPVAFTFKTPTSLQSTLSPHLNSYLYEKEFLSDLTLKLSDGDFPAHRLILNANSVYFHNTFLESNDSVLDMTHYNPKSYRCLLQYFYQAPLSNLIASDLFDLYTLATSYKETEIAKDVLVKLKADLNASTVSTILRKANEVNCTEVKDECNAFIRSPEFKHILAEKVSQDMEKTISLLEVLEKN